MAASRLCSIPDCGKPHSAHGWCPKHYMRWRKHGDPLVVEDRSTGRWARRYFREVVLTYEGADCLFWPFSRGQNGYGQIDDEGRPKPTPKHVAAHNCGKGQQGCVAKGHLRWATHIENTADRIIHGTLKPAKNRTG